MRFSISLFLNDLKMVLKCIKISLSVIYIFYHFNTKSRLFLDDFSEIRTYFSDFLALCGTATFSNLPPAFSIAAIAVFEAN